MERDVNALVSDAKKRRVNENISVVIVCCSLSDDDVIIDDRLVNQPGVLLLPKQVRPEDDSGTNVDVECYVLWDEVVFLGRVRVWEPVGSWDDWETRIHDLSGID